MQHLEVARRFSDCDLYDGDPRSATGRMRALDGELRGSVLMRIPIIRVTVMGQEARLCLARCARGLEDDPAPARRLVRRLRREGRSDARLRALLTEAGAASLEGGDFGPALDEAIELAETHRMRLVQVCAELRAGQWGGEALRREQAERSLGAMGVCDPGRWVASMIPGAEAVAG